MTGTFEGVGSLQFSPDNKYCLAYSGTLPTTTSSQTALEVTTNSEYVIFEAFFTGPIDFSDPTAGREANWQLSLNDDIIAHIRTDTSEGDIKNQGHLIFMAPPFTTIKIEVDGNDSASGFSNCVLLTGKVYGAIEQENLESITDNNKWASL